MTKESLLVIYLERDRLKEEQLGGIWVSVMQ